MGSGRLQWSAFSNNKALAVSTPNESTIQKNHQPLIIMVPSSYDFSAEGTAQTSIQVIDANGSFHDYREIIVTVGLDTLSPDSGNLPPETLEDIVSTEQGKPVDIDVLLNDRDVDSVQLLVVSVSQSENGSVSVNENGTVRYRSHIDFTGMDSFTYIVRDVEGNRSEGTVSVSVSETTEFENWTVYNLYE